MSERKVDVLFADNHLLVLNKPPLLATMGAPAGTDSLIAQAKDYIGRKYNKPGNVYLGVVSRLDSFVSGVVVFARTSKAASRLSEQFRQGTVEKTYWAIIPAGLQNQTGSLTHWVWKDETRHRMFATPWIENKPAPENAKLAKLNYRLLGQPNDGKQVVEVDLETGRKHQIRVQMSASGFPIVGDKKYDSQFSFARGIALHSKELQLVHPTLKTVVNFTTPPPNWWRLERFRI